MTWSWTRQRIATCELWRVVTRAAADIKRRDVGRAVSARSMLCRPPRQAVSRRGQPSSRAQDEVRPCCCEARGGSRGGRGRVVSRDLLPWWREASDSQSARRTSTQHNCAQRNRERKRRRLGERATGLWHCCSRRGLSGGAAGPASICSCELRVKALCPNSTQILTSATRARRARPWRGSRGAQGVISASWQRSWVGSQSTMAVVEAWLGAGNRESDNTQHHRRRCSSVGGVRVAAAPGPALLDSRARTARAGLGICRAACHDTPRWGRIPEGRFGASL